MRSIDVGWVSNNYHLSLVHSSINYTTSIIWTITLTLLSDYSYTYTIVKSGVSDWNITKIHQEYCSRAAECYRGHLVKLFSDNITYTKRLFNINKVKAVVQTSKTLSTINTNIISV